MSHVQHALRLASTLACGIVLIAFGMWASDQTRAASQTQTEQVAATPAAAPAAQPAPAPEPEHGGIRGAIEDANDTLTAPFDGVTSSTNQWAQRGVPMLLALLTYGLLARLLIPYLRAG